MVGMHLDVCSQVLKLGMIVFAIDIYIFILI